jgi:hypothetical protein
MAAFEVTTEDLIRLTPAQLSKASQNELSISNGPLDTLPDLIRSSSRTSSLLVINALEKFEGEALYRTIELLRALHKTSFAGWKVIFPVTFSRGRPIVCSTWHWAMLSRSRTRRGF